jgi:hypothetical protein
MRSPKLLGTVLSMGPSACSLRAFHCIVNLCPSKTCSSYNSSICSAVLTSGSVHATISPSLLNPASQDGQPVRSKMIDFAIVLRPNEKLASALPLTGGYIDGGVRFFNHTRYGPLTNKPIVVSIETKPEGESLQDAEIQLQQLISVACATC